MDSNVQCMIALEGGEKQRRPTDGQERTRVHDVRSIVVQSSMSEAVDFFQRSLWQTMICVFWDLGQGFGLRFELTHEPEKVYGMQMYAYIHI